MITFFMYTFKSPLFSEKIPRKRTSQKLQRRKLRSESRPRPGGARPPIVRDAGRAASPGPWPARLRPPVPPPRPLRSPRRRCRRRRNPVSAWEWSEQATILLGGRFSARAGQEGLWCGQPRNNLRVWLKKFLDFTINVFWKRTSALLLLP